MNINGTEITITEDSLTNAVFNGSALAAFGSFTKAEARQAAKMMLAGPELLEALQEIITAADGEGWSQLDAGFTKARAAVAKAMGND